MTVILDVGDREDTHAKNKKPMGERLVLLALGDTYQMTNDYESPIFNEITFAKDTCLIHFKGEFSCLRKDIRRNY